MKILIVDDDESRSASLSSHLVSACSIHSSEITTTTNTDDTKKLLRNCYYDILILDVVLPKRHGETARLNAGVALLSYLDRTSILHKPEKIVGLTAHVEDISRYKASFEEHCLTVIEASSTSGDWKKKVAALVGYTQSSKIARVVSKTPLHVLTVHGIRTFGGWQTRLEHLVKRQVGNVIFSAYKYGYFTALAFLMPPIRDREVKKLARHLSDLFKRHSEEQFAIFSHSFGTYLVAYAIKMLIADGQTIPAKLIVLSGSVLPQNFDWKFLLETVDAKIINDCADRDYVLWLSEAFVLNTGMAGKGGFLGLHGNRVINRYFVGGHSSYFKGDNFMMKYWLPLLALEQTILSIDERHSSTFIHGGIEKVVILFGWGKGHFYLAVVTLFIAIIASYSLHLFGFR